MNVFITGASGLVGKNLIKKLDNCDNINKIFCLYRKLPEYIISDKIVPIIGDVDTLSNISIKEPIHKAIHLIGYWKKENMKLLYKINVEGTKNFIAFCKKNHIKSIIYVSSINVKLINKGNYARTKLMAEKEIINSSINYIIMRPTLIYGNGDIGLSKLCKMIKRSCIIPVIGNGKALEQPIYVEEVAEYLKKAILDFQENIIMPIAGKYPIEYDKMINIIAAQINKKIRIIHLPIRLISFCVSIIEKLKVPFPINSEQIAHISEDLKVDNTEASCYYNVNLQSFEKNILNLDYLE
ncbi:NAD-dependent epimerase/dehydratase family protein [Vallitalea sp.]|jgi:NADH dehydrogenase|uniref:NAD-dependent epimerase/dehydratase family protein n=1 Tax=Vallitalea sp. TaxID=1882829 RepID=UPI0025CE930B|nr:NAD-dependent epimerase/dehydratase family protein [Vallitalea sp.]MCT4686480.1 NAD-dependent epimerase/dehydratase family protein [Vallitalea sp.]